MTEKLCHFSLNILCSYFSDIALEFLQFYFVIIENLSKNYVIRVLLIIKACRTVFKYFDRLKKSEYASHDPTTIERLIGLVWQASEEYSLIVIPTKLILKYVCRISSYWQSEQSKLIVMLVDIGSCLYRINLI